MLLCTVDSSEASQSSDILFNKVTPVKYTLKELKPEYERLYGNIKIPINNPPLFRQWRAVIGRIQEGESQYTQASQGMPWFFLGILHYLEGNCNFLTHIHNGDPLSDRTVNSPAGRPKKPPTVPGEYHPNQYEWVESALDWVALKKPILDVAREDKWSLASALWVMEANNGWGYRKPGRGYSPYLWSGTVNYTKGKFASDGVYDPELVSKQIGGAFLLYNYIRNSKT